MDNLDIALYSSSRTWHLLQSYFTRPSIVVPGSAAAISNMFAFRLIDIRNWIEGGELRLGEAESTVDVWSMVLETYSVRYFFT